MLLNTSKPLDDALFTLSRQPRAADAGALSHVISRAAVLRRARRDRGADPRPPDPARAEGRHPLSVADVPPQDSVSVGRAPPHPQLAAARCCAPPRWRCVVAGVLAAVLQAGSASRPRRRRPARARSSSCSIDRRAWATAITGRARKAEAPKIVDALGGDDRGDARAVRARHRGDRARDVRSRPARRPRSTRPTVTSDAHALRARRLRLAQSAPEPVAAAAQRGVPHQRLPEDRLGAAGRNPPARGRDAHAGVGRRVRDVGPVRVVRRAAAVVVLRRGARHADGGPHQSRRGDRSPTSRSSSRSTGARSRSRPVTIGPNASASVTFPAFTVAEANMHGTIRAGTDKLPKDNVFHFVLSPSRPVSVLVVEAEARPPARAST